jgi:hypothetical protein
MGVAISRCETEIDYQKQVWMWHGKKCLHYDVMNQPLYFLFFMKCLAAQSMFEIEIEIVKISIFFSDLNRG